MELNTKEMKLREAIKGRDFNTTQSLLLSEEDIDINKVYQYGETALYWAARCGSIEIVTLLLSNMSTEAINKYDNFGRTALYPAVLRPSWSANLNVVEFLLNNMSTEAINKADNAERTVLHYAVQRPAWSGHLNIIELLLNNMSTEAINKVNDIGITALHGAILHSTDDVTLLLKNGADVNQVDRDGATALHWIIRLGNLDIVEFVLLKMIPERIKQVDQNGRTALHKAVQIGNVEIVNLFLKNISEAAINQANTNGETALHWAVKFHKNEMVKLLIESGKCDLSGTGGMFSIYLKDDPEMLIKISQQKPGIFDHYVHQIETIAQKKHCPILLLYCGKEKLNIDDDLSYSIKGKKSLIIASHNNVKSIISMHSVVEFLDYQSAFNLYQAFQGLNIASNPLGLYKISHTNFHKITLTLENGTLPQFLKESSNDEYDFVWNQEKNSFDYLNSEENQQIELIGQNDDMMYDKTVICDYIDHKE